MAHREERDPNQVLGMPGRDRAYSEETARRIDEEVAAILDDGYGRAKGILDDHREVLERVVQVLFEREIMEGAELRQMLGKAEASARPAAPAPARAEGPRAHNGEELPSPSRAPAADGPASSEVSPAGDAPPDRPSAQG